MPQDHIWLHNCIATWIVTNSTKMICEQIYNKIILKEEISVQMVKVLASIYNWPTFKAKLFKYIMMKNPYNK